MTESLALAGDNNPPPNLLLGDDLRLQLETGNADLLKRRDSLIEAEARLPDLTTQEAAGKATDYVKLLNAAIKASEAARTAAKEPYDAGGKTVQAFFKVGVADKLDAIKTRVLAKLTVFQRAEADKERKRLQAEAEAQSQEANRIAAEAAKLAANIDTDESLDAAIDQETAAVQAKQDAMDAADAAAAKASALTESRGDFGGQSSLRTTWKFEVMDVTVVPREFLMVNESVVKAHIKARTEGKSPSAVSGIRFYEDTQAVVR